MKITKPPNQHFYKHFSQFQDYKFLNGKETT